MNVTPQAARPQKLEVAAEVALDLVRQSVPMAFSVPKLSRRQNPEFAGPLAWTPRSDLGDLPGVGRDELRQIRRGHGECAPSNHYAVSITQPLQGP